MLFDINKTHSIYISSLIIDDIGEIPIHYNIDFNRVTMSDIKYIFEKVWEIGKVKEIETIKTYTRDNQIKLSSIVHSEIRDLYNSVFGKQIIDNLVYDRMDGNCKKTKYWICRENILLGEGPYFEIELMDEVMLYGLSRYY